MDHLLPELDVDESGKIFFCYNIKALICKNGYVNLRFFKYPISKTRERFRKVPKSEDQANSKKKRLQQCQLDNIGEKEPKFHSIRYDSLSRTRTKIIEYASQNADKFKSFITLTYAENQQDIDKANKDFSNYIRQVKRHCESEGREFYYLGVPEFQDRGAIHYHLFVSEECGSYCIPYQKKLLKTKDSKTGEVRKTHYYEFPYWNHGYTYGENLMDEKKFDENFNLALYMCKYLYKDLDHRLFGRNKILKSNNLEAPEYKYLDDDFIYQHAIAYIDKRYDHINFFETYVTNQDFENYLKSHSILLKGQDKSYIENIIHKYSISTY